MSHRLPNSQINKERLLRRLEALETKLDPKGEFERILIKEIQLINEVYNAGLIDREDKDDLINKSHKKRDINKQKFNERLKAGLKTKQSKPKVLIVKQRMVIDPKGLTALAISAIGGLTMLLYLIGA